METYKPYCSLLEHRNRPPRQCSLMIPEIQSNALSVHFRCWYKYHQYESLMPHQCWGAQSRQRYLFMGRQVKKKTAFVHSQTLKMMRNKCHGLLFLYIKMSRARFYTNLYSDMLKEDQITSNVSERYLTFIKSFRFCWNKLQWTLAIAPFATLGFSFVDLPESNLIFH